MFLSFYLCTIILVNLGFSYIEPFTTPLGIVSPMAVLVGLVFVLRDYAQREVGHWVLPVMVAGLMFSYFLADPSIAVASAVSFALSETVDWIIYTVTKKPFAQRVLLSSLVAIPIDTFAFLYLIDFHSFSTFCLMVLSKAIASLVVWLIYRKETRNDHTA